GLHLRRARLPLITTAVPIKKGTKYACFLQVDVVHDLLLFLNVPHSDMVKAQVDQHKALFRFLDSPRLFAHAVNNQQVAWAAGILRRELRRDLRITKPEVLAGWINYSKATCIGLQGTTRHDNDSHVFYPITVEVSGKDREVLRENEFGSELSRDDRLHVICA